VGFRHPGAAVTMIALSADYGADARIVGDSCILRVTFVVLTRIVWHAPGNAAQHYAVAERTGTTASRFFRFLATLAFAVASRVCRTVLESAGGQFLFLSSALRAP